MLCFLMEDKMKCIYSNNIRNRRFKALNVIDDEYIIEKKMKTSLFIQIRRERKSSTCDASN